MRQANCKAVNVTTKVLRYLESKLRRFGSKTGSVLYMLAAKTEAMESPRVANTRKYGMPIRVRGNCLPVATTYVTEKMTSVTRETMTIVL